MYGIWGGSLPPHKMSHRSLDKAERVLVNGKIVRRFFNWNVEEGWAIGRLFDEKGRQVSDELTGEARWVRYYGQVTVEWKAL